MTWRIECDDPLFPGRGWGPSLWGAGEWRDRRVAEKRVATFRRVRGMEKTRWRIMPLPNPWRRNRPVAPVYAECPSCRATVRVLPSGRWARHPDSLLYPVGVVLLLRGRCWRGGRMRS